MSAWIVSKKHIDLLVEAAKLAQMNGVEADQLGQTLWEENHKSVNCRYSETRPTPTYKFKPTGIPFDPVVVIKQVNCLEYQSCEHDGWKDSKARQFCEELRNEMISMLPGYDKAPWGID